MQMPLEAPSSGDLPLMVGTKKNRWVTVSVDLDTIDKTENDKGWSCYHTDSLIVDGEEDETGEIPFWAMEPFFDIYDALPKKEQKGVFELEYKRTEKGGRNYADFRLEEE